MNNEIGDFNSIINNQLHDELAQEIISEQPSILERRFLWLVWISLFIMLVCSWLIRYPDVIEGTSIIDSKTPPQKLSFLGKKKIKYFIPDKHPVNKGDKIIVLETGINEDFILRLGDLLDSLLNNKISFKKVVSKLDTSRVGYIGPFWRLYTDFLSNAKSIQSRKNLDVDPSKDFNTIEKVSQLYQEIKDWELQNIIYADFNGVINYNRPLDLDMPIESKEILGYNIPLDESLYAKISLNQQNFFKIDTGMLARIELDAYPSNEFGTLTGKIKYLSSIVDSSVNAIVVFDTTHSNNKKIILRFGLRGKGYIITNKKRLFFRIVENIFK